MKRSRFSEQQIAFILHQAEDGVAVEDVCRKAGISLQTYYRWRKKYGGLMPSEMKRLKLLEEENVRLKVSVSQWPQLFVNALNVASAMLLCAKVAERQFC